MLPDLMPRGCEDRGFLLELRVRFESSRTHFSVFVLISLVGFSGRFGGFDEHVGLWGDEAGAGEGFEAFGLELREHLAL